MTHVLSESVRDRIIAELTANGPVAPQEVLSDTCVRPVAHVRQAAYAKLRSITDASGRPRYSLPEIGRAFGRDHTTILFGLRQHAKRTGEAN